MRTLWNSFKIGFSMYSKIPMPKSDWTKENMKYAMCFFPLIGVVIGGFIGLWYHIQSILSFGSIFSTVVYITIPILVTGGIHMDGLLDTADALCSYQPQERKLEILKDPNTGAFAVIICVMYILLDFGIWSEISKETIGILCCSFVLSRSLSGYGVVTLNMAKDTGLAATFSEAAKRKRVKRIMEFYVVIISAVLIWINPILGGFCISAAILTFLYYRHMAYKQFGGITGDLAGYFLQLCELVMAVVVIIVERGLP